MNRSEILFHGVSFAYDTASGDLFAGLSLHLPLGWTGVVGANGAGKTTLMRLAIGALSPRSGSIQAPSRAAYCPQRTDDVPAGLDELLGASAGEALALCGRLGLQPDWLVRWGTLSHGERKRAQIGAALWSEPAVLAVDEPTNHIDAEARDLLRGALARYRGVGLLVSHDRELLDGLCRQCLFVEPPGAVMRPGGYSAGAAQAAADEEAARREHETARDDAVRLQREVVRRRDEAGQSHRRRSKRGLGKDNDARFKRNLARKSGKDGVSGRLLNQLGGRLRQAQERVAATRVGRTYELGIWLDGALSPRDLLLELPAGDVALGAERRLVFPSLHVRPDEHVAITGANGMGKSTLLRHLVPRLNVEPERLVYLPQEISAVESRAVLASVRELDPAELGATMSVVSRLGSRPGRLLDSVLPSPGEVRKLLLAMGIARTPHVIVMDEPTNHLDLPSIECLEGALEGCPCGLILVSHDNRFLRRLTGMRWHLAGVDSAHSDQVGLRTGPWD